MVFLIRIVREGELTSKNILERIELQNENKRRGKNYCPTSAL